MQVALVNTPTIAGEVPLANHKYIVKFVNENVKKNSTTQREKIYSYTTPSTLTDIGATAALQMEFINLQIIAQMNADTANNYVTATTLGTGLGITVTDVAGYYPPKQNLVTGGRKGATAIIMQGFSATTSVVSISTPAVYQFGDGTWLSNNSVIYSPYFQNIVSGSYENPKAVDGSNPVAGQFYDAFTITSLVEVVSPTGMSGQLALQLQTQTVFVDNGTGAATTNATGYIAFERSMHKLLFGLYKSNPSSVVEFFDQNFSIQGPLGAVPVTTTATNNSLAVYNKFITPYGLLEHRNIGTQTIVSPTQGASGLLIDQDINTGDGAHYSPSLYTLNSQQFVVGSQEFSVMAKFTATAVIGANFQVGFHEKNAFFLDFNDYVSLATVGTNSAAGAVTTRGILADAATVSTVSGTATVNSVMSDFMVKVAIDGTVTCIVDNVVYPIYSAGTTPLKFAAGTVLVPFYQETCITGTAAVGTISKFVAIPSKDWRI